MHQLVENWIKRIKIKLVFIIVQIYSGIKILKMIFAVIIQYVA